MENKELKEAFDEFYLEIFEEFRTYGSLEELQVCENMCDHLLGNVYVKYSDEVRSIIPKRHIRPHTNVFCTISLLLTIRKRPRLRLRL